MAANYTKEIRETAEGLRLIDDTLFRLVAEDIPACQEIIRELLDDDNIEVIKAIPQRRLGGLNRTIIVDLLCKTADGSYINVEVQTGDRHDDFRRTRLHASIITSQETPTHTEFAEVPDVTILYITEYDAAKRNKTVIKSRRCLFDDDEHIEVPDGETIVYATTAVDDGSSHSKLLQLFLRKDAFVDNDSHRPLSLVFVGSCLFVVSVCAAFFRLNFRKEVVSRSLLSVLCCYWRKCRCNYGPGQDLKRFNFYFIRSKKLC